MQIPPVKWIFGEFSRFAVLDSMRGFLQRPAARREACRYT
jgi:hypothetical protein